MTFRLNKDIRQHHVGIKVLGCDKNTVESEYLAGLLSHEGFEVSLIQDRLTYCDVAVILTCCFIEEARRETLDCLKAFLRSGEYSRNKPSLVVAGCMPQVFLPMLQESFPEIDAFVGIVSPQELVKVIKKVLSGLSHTPLTKVSTSPEVKIDTYIPRRQMQRRFYSFLRIADGCNHKCSFCIIPKIKGPYRSLDREIVLKEARHMVEQGVKEINIIAQDITRYGKDLYGKEYGLVELLRDLCAMRGDFWIRLLYAYPTGISNRLLEIIVQEPRICKYLDIPLQHLDDTILKDMRRPFTWERVRELVKRIRNAIPEITLRSTFIIGYPGETIQRFNRLEERLARLAFDRVGFFLYSPERQRRTTLSSHSVSPTVARRRLTEIATLQAEMSRMANEEWVGAIKEVLVEAKFPDTSLYLGRSQSEAPEVDGFIVFSSEHQLNPGEKVEVQIQRADSYELYGAVVDVEEITR